MATKDKEAWPSELLTLGPRDNNGLPFFLQLLPRNQVVHPIQKDLATCLALLGLVLGFGESDLIHKSFGILYTVEQ